MKSIPVILMGCGGGLRLRVVGVADSKSLLSVPDIFTTELDDDSINEICRLKSNGSSLDSLTSLGDYQVFSNSETITNISEIASHLVRSTGDEGLGIGTYGSDLGAIHFLGLAVVDCSASADTIVILQKVLELGGCIVLANKKPLTSSMEDYDRLASHPRRLRHESTVGAGLPVIMSINRLLSSGDTIHRIVGSLSGTLGYVMSEVEDGKPLSQVVKTAKTLGYTEPDPRDDLGGMDVARKALIIARLLGQRIDLDSIKVESLYPAEMGPDAMSVEEFLDNGVSQVDSHLADRVEKAASKGHVLRYVCVIEGSRTGPTSPSLSSMDITLLIAMFILVMHSLDSRRPPHPIL
ncbi:Bifunctional aspartokinase/homoserine dehydrogenase 1 [Bienertia sinuspersici]